MDRLMNAYRTPRNRLAIVALFALLGPLVGWLTLPAGLSPLLLILPRSEIQILEAVLAGAIVTNVLGAYALGVLPALATGLAASLFKVRPVSVHMVLEAATWSAIAAALTYNMLFFEFPRFIAAAMATVPVLMALSAVAAAVCWYVASRLKLL